MMRSGACSAALALLLVCLALTSNAEAGRTHELFAQSTYYEQPTTTDEKAAAVVAEPLGNVDDSLPEKTTTSTTATAQASTVSEPQQAAVSTDNGTPHDPESARAESSSTLVDIPKKPQQQQHYRDYRGTTPVQGDFIPDARPWWFNPQYANNVQGRNPELDQQSKADIPSIPTTPNRYPRGYPVQYMGPEFSYSQSSNPANAQYSAIHNGQYSSIMQEQQQQYVPNRFPQYTSSVPYEMTSGGCPTQYWMSNTHRWPAFFTVKTTVGDALGTPASKVFGQTTLLQALLNTRPDGYSTLLRSAATAILNSYSRSQYKYSHVNVIESFAAALSNSTAAAEQAAAFEEANVSAYHEQYNSCA